MNASSSDIGKKLSRSKYPPLGALAIHYGTLTPMQMDDAMEAVAKRKGLPADLPEILVEMGFTTHQQIDLLKALLEYHHTREAGVRFGSIAIEKGYATEKDIEEALNIQIRLFRETKQNKRMGDIMVSEGIISPEERDLVLDELKKREKIDSEPVAKPGKSRFEESFLETRRKDELFAKIVLEKRYATESQVNHARMVQKALGESTKQIKLVGEILVEKGTLSMEQFSDILSSQGRSREINEINSKISPFVTVTVSRDHTQVQVSPAGLMPEGEMAELIVKTLKDQGIIHGIQR